MESWLEFVPSITLPKGNTYPQFKPLFPNLRVPREFKADLKANQATGIEERRIEEWHHFSDATLVAFFILSGVDLALSNLWNGDIDEEKRWIYWKRGIRNWGLTQVRNKQKVSKKKQSSLFGAILPNTRVIGRIWMALKAKYALDFQ